MFGQRLASDAIMKRPLGMAALVAAALLVGLAACGRAAPRSATPSGGETSTAGVVRSTPTTAPGMVVKAKGIVTAMKGGFVSTSSESVDYGIVLRNTSSKLAAIGVEVKVTVVSAGGTGTSPSPSSILLSGVPAGGTFYVSGSALRNGGTPSRMDVTISVERTSMAHFVLPPVTKVSLTGSLLPHATGAFQNPYPRSAAEQEWLFNEGGILYLVYFGSHGQVVGGAQLNLDTLTLPATGKTGKFTARTAAPSAATSVEASVDPCDNMLGLSTSCVAFQ